MLFSDEWRQKMSSWWWWTSQQVYSIIIDQQRAYLLSTLPWHWQTVLLFVLPLHLFDFSSAAERGQSALAIIFILKSNWQYWVCTSSWKLIQLDDSTSVHQQGETLFYFRPGTHSTVSHEYLHCQRASATSASTETHWSGKSSRREDKQVPRNACSQWECTGSHWLVALWSETHRVVTVISHPWPIEMLIAIYISCILPS